MVLFYGALPYAAFAVIFFDRLGYRHGASYLTVQYRHGASYLTVLYRHGASNLTVLYRHLITTYIYYTSFRLALRANLS